MITNKLILFITLMICKDNANEHKYDNDIDYDAILDNGDDSSMITTRPIAIIIIAVPNVDNK